MRALWLVACTLALLALAGDIVLVLLARVAMGALLYVLTF